MYSVFSNVKTIRGFFRSLKWAWQRAIKGYCELDTYSVSDWFLNTLPDMLGEIKKNYTGYPDELTEDEWVRILDRMIFLLREANEDTCTKVDSCDGYAEEEHNLNVCKDEALELFSKWFYSLGY